MDDLLNDRLLTAELWERFPGARLRVFAPNLRAAVVQRLAAILGVPRGGIVSGRGCVCNFLAHWEPFIANAGGFAVVCADVHGRVPTDGTTNGVAWQTPSAPVVGSFKNGCGMLLGDLAARRTLCPAAQPHTFVSFAASSLKDRFVHGSREIALQHTEALLQSMGGFGEEPYEFRVSGSRHYDRRSVRIEMNQKLG